MAVRGLGCPVRFALTAGQKGDAPQAEALLAELPAEVVMADAAYDSDAIRDVIAAKGALARRDVGGERDGGLRLIEAGLNEAAVVPRYGRSMSERWLPRRSLSAI